MKNSWYNNRWFTLSVHALAWILLFSLPFLLRPGYGNNRPANPEPKRTILIIQYVCTDLLYISLFYMNAFILIPRLINKRKYWRYAGMLSLTFLVVISVAAVLFISFMGRTRFNIQGHILFNTFFFLFIIATSTAFRLIRDRIELDKLAKETETENLKTELSLLRSQVSPHFMFNVLNNMVALARKKSDLLEPSLIKLSSLMRYMLYETDEEKVLLEKEIEYLQSYIDLQQQRYGKNVKVNTRFCARGNHYEIEPMLLIPFVENAFKHGTGFIPEAEIDIELKTENDHLFFTVRNRYNRLSDEVKDKTSGIGLPNVKRRLNLLYGQNHRLEITKKDNWFTTSLELNLH